MPNRTPPHSSNMTPRSLALPFPLVDCPSPSFELPEFVPGCESHPFHRLIVWNFVSSSEIYPDDSEIMQDTVSESGPVSDGDVMQYGGIRPYIQDVISIPLHYMRRAVEGDQRLTRNTAGAEPRSLASVTSVVSKKLNCLHWELLT